MRTFEDPMLCYDDPRQPHLVRKTNTLTVEKPTSRDPEMERLLRVLVNSFECIKTDQNRILALLGDIQESVSQTHGMMERVMHHQLTLFPMETPNAV